MATKKQADPVANILATYIATRNERLALDEQSKKLKVKEDVLLDNLKGLQDGSYQHPPYNLVVSHKKVPRCTDWGLFHDYVKATGNFDMLHKRLTETAVMARIENKEYVPGVVTDDKPVYKITMA